MSDLSVFFGGEGNSSLLNDRHSLELDVGLVLKAVSTLEMAVKGLELAKIFILEAPGFFL